jgi:DNA modification methylase
MPEPVTDRCCASHEYIFLLSKSPSYFFDGEAIQEPAIYAGDNRGERGDSRRGTSCKSMNGSTGEFRRKRSVWTVATQPYKGAHFATFPPELIKPCILAGSPIGGVVCDPFAGSGTTARVAFDTDRQFCGSEVNAEYCRLFRKRMGELQRKLEVMNVVT